MLDDIEKGVVMITVFSFRNMFTEHRLVSQEVQVAGKGDFYKVRGLAWDDDKKAIVGIEINKRNEKGKFIALPDKFCINHRKIPKVER